ncbi:MAG: DUF5658 family protein [Planctomycetota bacterium]
MPAPSVSPEDRRDSGDRRARPTPMFSWHALLGGRRQASRREEERWGGFVDSHGYMLFLVVSLVLVMNVLDALFTVLFLSCGAEELNPLVAASLESGLWTFLTMKSVVIGVCVAFLTVTKNFRVSRAGLAVVFTGYSMLLGWHGYLYCNLSSFVLE